MKTTPVFIDGYYAKSREIRNHGWNAACEEFNRVYPPGQKFTGSPSGYQYMMGESEALVSKLDQRY